MSFTDTLATNKTTDPFVLATTHIANISKIEEIEIREPRASTIYDACMRMHVLCTILKRSQKRYYSIKDILTFGIGKAVHFWCQNSPEIFGEERYGLWKCSACGYTRQFQQVPVNGCPKCGMSRKATIYHEFGDIIQNPYTVSFHVDLFRKVGDCYRISEIKTISRDSFEKLVAPKIEHEYQLVTYILGCYYSKKFPVKFDPKVSYIYYLSKEHTAKTIPIKAFEIHTNKAILKKVQDKLTQYKKGLIDYPNNLPDIANDCKSKNFDCWKAKICPVKEECKRL